MRYCDIKFVNKEITAHPTKSVAEPNQNTNDI